MRLSVTQPDGATLRTHLQRAHAATGRRDSMLAAVAEPMPESVAKLWDAYRALAGTRARSAEGIAPIACVEIEAWQRMSGVALTPWEFGTLLLIDRAARVAAG